MALKNKDGTLYKLSKPNPLTIGQKASFDKSKITIYNFLWKDVIFEKTAPLEKKKPPVPQKLPEETPIKAELPPPSLPQVEEPSPDIVIPRLKNKVLMHCQPVIKKTVTTNSFYDESFYRLIYGDKFIFEAVLLEGTDFDISFWSTDPNDKITISSIVYPFSWVVWNEKQERENKVPFDEYRWWKVVTKEEKDGGWTFTATISENQPDFSS